MPKGLVVYDSKTGNTEKLAMAIGKGMQKAGLDASVKKVERTSLDDLAGADAIVLGSPTYFATMSAKMKDFIDKSIRVYPDKLKDKVGAAFTSCGGVGGDTTLISLIQAMLLHRMIIVGNESGFGVVSIGNVNDAYLAEGEAFGERIAGAALALIKGKQSAIGQGSRK